MDARRPQFEHRNPRTGSAWSGVATPPLAKSAPASQISPVPVTDESIIELARKQLQELVIPNIVPFEGDVLKYRGFKLTFQSEVHKLSLHAAKRLEALRSSLRGPPLSIIQYAPSTEEGYLYAWDMLDSRYEGRLRVASATMEAFLQFPGPDPSIDSYIAWLSQRQIMLDQSAGIVTVYKLINTMAVYMKLSVEVKEQNWGNLPERNSWHYPHS
uniref:Uncharacterized protein n=1 Tax=Rhodnius prolixus TaxID=13249 RepID=T1I5Q8_RHOPR